MAETLGTVEITVTPEEEKPIFQVSKVVGSRLPDTFMVSCVANTPPLDA